jgi:hypothetical protein
MFVSDGSVAHVGVLPVWLATQPREATIAAVFAFAHPYNVF